jgi:predicted membrane-bound spermidine synthase
VIVAAFFASGFAALIYQIIWQRALFTIFGINVEAVSVVVTGFLLGLGFGSLFGGWLSRTSTAPLLVLFGLIEIAIGAFGAISLHVFQWAGARTIHLPVIIATTATLVLLIIPTLFMGATLPILTQYFVQRARNVGRSVGLLYCINTLGSAAACFVSAFWLMRLLGMQNSIRFAAAINVLVGVTGLCQAYRRGRQSQATPTKAHSALKVRGAFAREQKSTLLFAFIVSMLTGYVSLSYEVIWFRAFMIGTNQAQAFALILGAYLGGLAFGSCWVRRYFGPNVANPQLLYMLCVVILLSSVLGFSVLPLAAQAASLGGWSGFVFITLVLVFAQTAIAGIAFPVLCHVGFTADDRAGVHLSLLYVGNIVGSAAGSLITGFILMDQMSTAQISAFLTALGAIAAAAIAGLTPMSWPRRAAFIAVGFILIISSPFAITALFDHYYERLIYKAEVVEREARFVDVVENKSGVVTVNAKGVVYGGGIYDGMVSVDLIDDKNFLIRPFSLALYHPGPREVLMVGLGAGAWAQVLVNHPEVERLTIVEINPGYLSLIAKYPAVMKVLTNPKVEINIDDGRRWMNRNPHRKFDVIVQNTTVYFRRNATNLLSAEYLRLSASHLRERGVLMFNTTGSPRAQRTACMMFSYALRELNVMVASNAPLQLDPRRLRAMLEHYSIDGDPVFDRSNPIHRARLEEIMATLDPSALDQNGQTGTMETCQSIKSRTQDLPFITDDNMGEEWQQISARTFAHGIVSMLRNL